jgi:chromosomal replication initiation ATPase DnaA
MKPQEIGDRFNVRDTAVSEASRRLVRTLETDEELRGRIEKIKGKLEKCRM